MYKCQQCGRNTELRQSRQTITKYREVADKSTGALRKEIAQEVQVCVPCADLHFLTRTVQLPTGSSPGTTEVPAS